MKAWLIERFGTGWLETWKEIKEHPVPPHALNPIYCLGGLTFLSFLIQAVTGIILALYYRPTPEEAYASIQFIMEQVSFGAMIRSVHHYAANIMVLLVMLHMLRVFYTGSFKKPRELNWVVGVLLYLLTLAFGFTGYLLPWDQVAYWASVVGTEIMGGIPVIGKYLMILARGGLKVTEFTLTRFYVAHVIILPLLAILLMGLHFLMVRLQGISEEL
ncbi:cytochrome b6 [Carboxydocella sporoproducens DSM 16521]|uniref:Cytochrome b6 n=2 Tax=Carboxydocella TaxID=178898 RepID=A0A1T4QZS3_9FIRM|nr:MULTISPECIES: cytochrome b N-terminal domain-containing protein [Carboxydocella]AVX19794.1 cytochrome b6 [Carboxydocella thermautotrophica]SKA09126.1 cytochrome b6 [Carboxydocella sporoproducens DSM 16521]